MISYPKKNKKKLDIHPTAIIDSTSIIDKGAKIGENTKPITIPGGFLIIKLNDIKKEKIQYDTSERLNELIRISTNQQLNQLSNIYFQKVKKEIKIDEL